MTTIVVRAAVAGELDAVETLCARISPALLCRARRLLGGQLSTIYDPADLVQDTWMRAIPRLGDIEERGGRIIPPLMAFLGTTMKLHHNNLVRKHIQGKPDRLQACRSGGGDPVDSVSAKITNVTSRVAANDASNHIQYALERLGEPDEEIVVLRAFDGLSNADVGKLVGLSESAVKNRYSRALAKLRKLLPQSIFDELR